MTTTTNPQIDPLYDRARQILAANLGMGKGKLATLLGVRTPTSRRLLERWRGETMSHGTHPDCVRVRRLKDLHPEWGAARIAQNLGLSIDHAKLHLARWQGAQSFGAAGPVRGLVNPAMSAVAMPVDDGAADDQFEDTTSGDLRDLAYRGTGKQSVEELLASARVDPSLWQVSRQSLSMAERPAKELVDSEVEPRKIRTYSIRVTLRRRTAELNFQGILDSMLQQFRSAAPVLPPIMHSLKSRGLLEISMPDGHLGKIARGEETGGRDYDADIAERMFRTALQDLLGKASIMQPEKVLFIAGNDFLNTDNLGRTTTAGTPQDEMLRWPESFARGKHLLVWAIDLLREVAPTTVLMVPGNHDQQRLHYLGHVLEAWYHHTADVTVDASPRLRKYVHYHANLLGYCHGHEPQRHQALPVLMAIEQPEAWSKTRHRAWGLGRLHAKQSLVYVPHRDLSSVAVRILPSLCPADAWSAGMGYVGKLSAEAHFWDPEDGCVASFYHSPA